MPLAGGVIANLSHSFTKGCYKVFKRTVLGILKPQQKQSMPFERRHFTAMNKEGPLILFCCITRLSSIFTSSTLQKRNTTRPKKSQLCLLHTLYMFSWCRSAFEKTKQKKPPKISFSVFECLYNVSVITSYFSRHQYHRTFCLCKLQMLLIYTKRTHVMWHGHQQR